MVFGRQIKHYFVVNGFFFRDIRKWKGKVKFISHLNTKLCVTLSILLLLFFGQLLNIKLMGGYRIYSLLYLFQRDAHIIIFSLWLFCTNQILKNLCKESGILLLLISAPKLFHTYVSHQKKNNFFSQQNRLFTTYIFYCDCVLYILVDQKIKIVEKKNVFKVPFAIQVLCGIGIFVGVRDRLTKTYR